MTIGKLFHVAHITEDLAPLDVWYDRVFAPVRGVMDGHFAARVQRWGSLLVIGDAIIEAMSPGVDAEAATFPIGRFQARFGRHWHSVAWYCDDVGALWEQLRAGGIRVLGNSGAMDAAPSQGDMYTHPKDTFTQAEFFQPSVADGGPGGPGPFKDPRFESGWAERWAGSPNPLGIERLAYISVVVDDLERAKEIYCAGFGATLLVEEESALTGSRCAYVSVGSETVVELAFPTQADSLAGRELTAHGGMCHAVAFTVDDLDRTAAHLDRCGVSVHQRDATTILTDPADTYGAPFRFTTWRAPGDPRD